ncbi:hypothetical protein, partial [Streptomyces caniscabiei]|uniref:hypothetical protein n=1 Tax=Streptomyces caniscabiei TaxID=2746961 RepID=UPI001C4F5FDE
IHRGRGQRGGGAIRPTARGRSTKTPANCRFRFIGAGYPRTVPQITEAALGRSLLNTGTLGEFPTPVVGKPSGTLIEFDADDH